MWIWYLWTWFSDGLGSAWLMLGLDDLNDSVIQ